MLQELLFLRSSLLAAILSLVEVPGGSRAGEDTQGCCWALRVAVPNLEFTKGEVFWGAAPIGEVAWRETPRSVERCSST